ncbi:MAG: chromosome segregation ATPase [Candidatus Pseudothioglobus sp.]|jgi:chromosome segregation ATPase
MANNSKDFDLIPAIAPAKDEVASYRRSGRAEAPKQSNFNGLLVFALVIMAIMIGVGGFALYEVQKKLDQSNELLAQGQKSIRDLDDRLAATGTDVSKTLQVMKAQQKTNVTEIDKLWGVAFRSNRPRIEKMEVSIKNLLATDKQLDAKASAVTQRFNTFSEQVLGENEDLATRVALARGQVQDQSVLLEANRRGVLALQSKMKDAEEAISVIDRYRQQVNQSLVEIKRQLQTTNAPPVTP